MQVIPAIDLRGGIVVHARGGDRANYQPLQSKIVRGHNLIEVAKALIDVADCQAIYIADLDAIERLGHNDEQLAALKDELPGTQILLDSGVSELPRAMISPGVTPVIGTESLQCPGGLLTEQEARGRQFVLSLDHHGCTRLGPREVFQDTSFWPEQIIVMMLDRVGGSSGPNIDLVSHYRQFSPRHDFYAAGGARGLDDLMDMKDAGIAGALIASALHNGQLTSRQIRQLQYD